MRSLEFWILAYLLNSLWQVPLLFAAGWLAARALRSARRRGGAPRLGGYLAAPESASRLSPFSPGSGCARSPCGLERKQSRVKHMYRS